MSGSKSSASPASSEHKARVDSVRAQIHASLKQQREPEGTATLGDLLKAAADAAEPEPKEDPLFLEEGDKVEHSEGYVSLSSLVPTWGRASEPVSDLMVRVHDVSEHSESSRVHVPSMDPCYRPPIATLRMLAYAIEKTNAPVFLSGPAGVGKSSLPRHYCALTGRPFYRFNFNGSMDTSSLLGTTTASAGSTTYEEGFLPEAIRVPNAVILLDEISLAAPEVFMCLQYLLEPGGKLLLPDKPGSAADKFVTPAEGVAFLCADNTRGNGDVTGKYVGTQPQNLATMDRMGTHLVLDYLFPDEERDMLQAIFPKATGKLVSRMVQVANLTRTAYRQGGVSIPMSARVLQYWVRHSLNLRNVKQALEISFLNRLDSQSEVQAVLEMMESVFEDVK